MHENHLQQKKISLGFTLQHKLGIEKKSTKSVNKKLFHYYHYHPNVQCKAVLSEKLMGAQCSELVKSSVPSIYDSHEKTKISSRPRTKVRHHGPPGSARAKACMFDMHQSWNSKNSTSILGGEGGHTPAVDHYLCSMSGEFDLSLGRVGNLNRKFQVELLNTVQCVTT